MPISTERILKLLDAAEDAWEGVRQAEEILKRELHLVETNQQTPEQALVNLELMIAEDVLLSRPLTTKLTLMHERGFYSEARLRRNEKVRLLNQKRRKNF